MLVTIIIPASNINIEAANYSVFLIREISMLNVWPQIIEPSQSTTFPTPLKTWIFSIRVKLINKPEGVVCTNIYEISQKRHMHLNFKHFFSSSNHKTSVITSFLRKSNPIPSSSMLLYVLFKLCIFFWRPWPFLNTCFVTTWCSSHLSFSLCIHWKNLNLCPWGSKLSLSNLNEVLVWSTCALIREARFLDTWKNYYYHLIDIEREGHVHKSNDSIERKIKIYKFSLNFPRTVNN